MHLSIHPIMEQSFAVIDREIGEHNFTPAEYAIVRRVIHSTADFEFKQLIQFSPTAIARAIAAIQQKIPIVVDVGMVRQGITSLVTQTFENPLICAVEQVATAPPNRTRTEAGMLECFKAFPSAIFVVGNAPTALLALCDQLKTAAIQPTLVVGAPVGFISVLESKAALAQSSVPQILVESRKGSAVAAAIVNALLTLAWEEGNQL